ncbi:Pro-Pol polyprotein, partial [Mucuna pruriens]
MNSQISNYCTSKRLHHGLATSAIMWQHLSFCQRHLDFTSKNSKAMPNTTCAFLTPRSIRFSSFATQHLEAATMDLLGLPGKCWIPTIFRDAYQLVSTCKKCQKVRLAINRRHEMPQQPILFSEVFDVWGIDFMGPFLVSNGYSYILLAVDYVEAIATKTNDAKVVVDFLKSNIFYRFGVPKVLISDQGSNFYNRTMSSLLHKYGVVHRIATAYHPQTNGQAEVFNRKIKKMLQKMTNPSRKDWSRLLEDAFWAHRTAYRTSLRMSPYQIVFGKAYHLFVELDHKAY